MYKDIISYRDSGFIICVGHSDESTLREFVKNESGLEISCLERILNQDWKKPFDHLYLWLSFDLKKEDILCLHGWLDYTACGNCILRVDEFIKKYKKCKAMKDVVIIKHIPHASLDFPKEFPDGAMILESKNKYNLKMTDIGIDYLFKDISGIEIKAPYSRLFCDVEKFKDDSKEEMAKLGQGYIYQKTYDGETIARFGKVNKFDVTKYINNYYDDYHKKFDQIVQNIIKGGKKALILDLHSYSDELALANGNSAPFPDICIGVNEEYCNKEILELVISKIEEKGLTYQINYPYKGSILPNGLLNKKYDGDVTSIMLEVNKRIYL